MKTAECIIFFLTYVFVITLPMAYEFNKRDITLHNTKDIWLMFILHIECLHIFITWLVMVIAGYLIIL